MASSTAPESPRLARLVGELQSQTPGALDAFWREVGERGTPLVEPIPDDDRQVLLTFLWRATSSLDNVLLISELEGGYF